MHVVGAGTQELDVRAVVRAIVCVHRHEDALDALARFALRELVMNRQVRNPLADAKARVVAFRRMNIRLNVHVRLVRRKHHACRQHLNRLEIDERYLEVVRLVLDLVADRVLREARRRRRAAEREERCRYRADRQSRLEFLELEHFHKTHSSEK